MQVEHNFLAALGVLLGSLALVALIAWSAGGVPEVFRLRRFWRRLRDRKHDRHQQ